MKLILYEASRVATKHGMETVVKTNLRINQNIRASKFISLTCFNMEWLKKGWLLGMDLIGCARKHGSG